MSESYVDIILCVAGGSNDGVYHFKILVPSVAAGAIIGIGGETIGQLQKDTKARVKMSKAGDFYPGKLVHDWRKSHSNLEYFCPLWLLSLVLV